MNHGSLWGLTSLPERTNCYLVTKDIELAYIESKTDDNENNVMGTICPFCCNYYNEEHCKNCKECNYKICLECYDAYIKTYKNTKCPHCRSTIEISDTSMHTTSNSFSSDDRESDDDDRSFTTSIVSALTRERQTGGDRRSQLKGGCPGFLIFILSLVLAWCMGRAITQNTQSAFQVINILIGYAIMLLGCLCLRICCKDI